MSNLISDIFDIFIWSQCSAELYSKAYNLIIIEIQK